MRTQASAVCRPHFLDGTLTEWRERGEDEAGAMPRALSLILLFVTLLGLQSLFAISVRAEGCDSRCVTENCDEDGHCICKLPQNTSILDGDRSFFGGEFCDTLLTMCDGTNEFWCDHGECNEIVQGENYTCTCKDGYAGVHCELQGKACGDSFCYHGAACLQNVVFCDCPEEWRGSEDCSLQTLTNNTETAIVNKSVGNEDGSRDKWYFPFSAVVAAVVVGLGVFLGVKLLRRHSRKGTEFHKLQQVQMRGFIEEDEDAFSKQPLSKAELA